MLARAADCARVTKQYELVCKAELSTDRGASGGGSPPLPPFLPSLHPARMVLGPPPHDLPALVGRDPSAILFLTLDAAPAAPAARQ